MILVDARQGSAELIPNLQRLNVSVEKTSLEFGDFAFEGNGQHGKVAVGIERKTLHDMLACIEDSRYAGHQRPGMRGLYDVSLLIVEGHWRPHDPDGFLMEGFNNGLSWGFCKFRSQRTMYHKIYRYLISVAMTGVHVIHSRDMFHTAFNIVEWFHWFQKSWQNHASMQEMQKLRIPSISGKPPLVRRWAAELEGVGMKTSDLAARHFKTPIQLATADEMQWLRIPGIGVKTAQAIYREVNGIRK